MANDTLTELRRRYPQYRDMSDAALATAIITKYPEYKDLLGEIASSKPAKATYTFGGQVQSAIESFGPPALAAAGGVGGAILGAAAGGIGAIPGGVAGGVLGAMGGQNIAEITRPYLTGQPSAPPLESAARIGEAGLYGATGEIGGQVLGAGLKAVAAPLASKLSPLVRPAREAVPGLALTPAQMTQARGIDILENVAEASLLGGGRLQAFKGRQQDLIKTTADALAESFGSQATPVEVGQVFQRSVQKSREAFHAAAKSLYGEVDQLTPSPLLPITTTRTVVSPLVDAQGRSIERILSETHLREVGIVDMRPLKTTAQNILTKRGRLPKSLTSETGQSVLTDLANLPDQTTFANAQLMRSQLLKGARARDLADIETGLSKKFAGVLDEAMEGAARSLSGDAAEAYRAANAFYRSGVEQFQNKFIQSIVKKTPEKVAESIFQRGGVTLVRQARAAVDEAAWTEVQGAFLRRTIQNSTDDVTGFLSGRKLQNALFAKTGVSTEVLDAAYGNETRRKLQGLVDAIRLTQDRPSEGTGRIFIQLKQAGAATDVAGAAITFGVGFPKTAAMIMFGPAALSRVFTNPTAIQWLTTGLTLGPGTEAGARALSQLSAFAFKAAREGPPESSQSQMAE